MTGIYSVIQADPAWDYKTYSEKGRKKSPKYPVMSLEAMANLPVKRVTARNAVLFLWATWPTIEQAFFLIRSWGFEYRTLGFEWVKTTKDGTRVKMGTGYYTRAACEPCLLAVKGRMPVLVRNVPNVILAPPGKHSEKPEEAYRRIEMLYSSMLYPNRLELFASENSIQKARDWRYTPLGYDVDGRDLADSLRELI